MPTAIGKRKHWSKLQLMQNQPKLPVFLFFLFIFYCYSSTVVCLFSPALHPTPAEPTTLPHPTLPLGFVHVSSIVVPVIPSSDCPTHPRAILRLVSTSISLVIFCLLFSSIYYVPVKCKIIWLLSFTAWLISLSIMLSSFIHAVAKGISSFCSLLRRIPLCKYTIDF